MVCFYLVTFARVTTVIWYCCFLTSYELFTCASRIKYIIFPFLVGNFLRMYAISNAKPADNVRHLLNNVCKSLLNVLGKRIHVPNALTPSPPYLSKSERSHLDIQKQNIHAVHLSPVNALLLQYMIILLSCQK